MDKLVTTGQGGFPFFLNDLRYADDAVRLAITDIIKGIVGTVQAGEAVILYGCDHGNGSASEGVVYYNGELWHMYAHSYTFTTLGNLRLCFAVENDQAGSRIFKDASSHQVYQNRRAVLADKDSIPVSAIGNVVYLSSRRINNLGVSYANLEMESPSFEARPGKSISIIKIGTNVIVDVGIETNIVALNMGSWIEIATLPMSMKPNSRITGITLAEGSNGVLFSEMLAYEINTDGMLSIRALQEIQSVTNLSFNIHTTYII